MRIYDSLDELIGRTPLIRLHNIEREFQLEARLLAKLEFLNPGGSAKDRVAKKMIEEAEKKGSLQKGGRIIEPTSGNTGIGLALVGAARGYKATIVMPDTMSVERVRILEGLGAEVVLTPGEKGMAGCIEKAEELKRETPGAFIPGQFTNPDNPAAHYETTGPEIYEDTDGKTDIFVATVGTGGTITGTGRYLKEHCPGCRIVGVEPAASPLLTRGVSGPHKIQGIGANFIPEILDTSLLSEVLPVTDEDAFFYGRLLMKKEGILSGISSGAALAGAVTLAKRPENKDKSIVLLLPDTADRYLSTELFS